jgi:hypothetical protein
VRTVPEKGWCFRPFADGFQLSKDRGMKITLGTLGVLALLVASTVLDGWAVSVCWNWFMVPYLNMPHLAIVPAIGIRLTVGLFIHAAKRNRKAGLVRLHHAGTAGAGLCRGTRVVG